MPNQVPQPLERIAEYADRLSAMGSEPRLRIMQLLLSAHPDGLVVSEFQDELEIPNSTLSHHLGKLKGEDLVRVQRESTFLRYTGRGESATLNLFSLTPCFTSLPCSANSWCKPEQQHRAGIHWIHPVVTIERVLRPNSAPSILRSRP
jgi:DNA-binding transcriptional ArsR family regulator